MTTRPSNFRVPVDRCTFHSISRAAGVNRFVAWECFVAGPVYRTCIDLLPVAVSLPVATGAILVYRGTDIRTVDSCCAAYVLVIIHHTAGDTPGKWVTERRTP